MITLPTEITQAVNKDSRYMVLFGKPKAGKTTAVAQLKNSLIIDLEDGSWHVDCMSVKVTSVAEIGQVIQAIKASYKETGKWPYEFIVLDSVTKLEEMAEELALQIYKSEPLGKNYQGEILKLPNGLGYKYLREAMNKVIDALREIAPHLILVGHTKLSMIRKEDIEVGEMSIDLTGKISEQILGEADTVGYVYRDKSETHINFMAGDNAIVGSRVDHLRNKDIVIAKLQEDGKVSVDWSQIYKYI